MWLHSAFASTYSSLSVLAHHAYSPTGDGRADLLVANNGGVNFLYHNEGDGTFSKVTTGAVVTDSGDSTAVAFGDYDGPPNTTSRLRPEW